MTSEDPPLAALLRDERAAAGLTQEELAERAGLSVRTISDIERGLRTTIYRDTARRLASALRLEGAERARFEGIARPTAPRGPRKVPAAADPSTIASACIPVPPTKLIGRERELAVISAALADEGIRLLTLTGAGGIGKTRIAIEAATRARHDRRDVVFFVSLSALDNPTLVPSTIAVAMGVTSANEPVAETIAEQLGDGAALLVLDTFEHLMDAAPFVADLVARCSRLTILATSREPLHLRGEHEVVVPTLEAPMTAWASPAEDVLRSPATRLFVERASAAKNDFVIEDDSALIVRDICDRLNGLPLAIELAAARVKHLSLRALSKELDDRLSILTRGPRDLPRRQQSMRDTVAWSYDLLTPDEQTLFRRLSVFAGGGTIDAAASICCTGDEGTEPLNLMSTLVDKSLVVFVDAARDDVRYSMLDVIRAFALERCEAAGEMEWVHQRHAEFHVALAERAEPELGGAEQSIWFRRLETEHDNLRAALGWYRRRGNAEGALRLAGALWRLWRRQGHVSEGRMWLQDALLMNTSRRDGARAKALWGAGWLAFVQEDFDEGEALSAELIGIAKERGDRIEERNGLTVRGMILMARGQFQEALGPFEQARELCHDMGPTWYLATSHLNLGMAKMHLGDLEAAKSSIVNAREIYSQIGDKHFQARCLGYVGYTALLARDTAHARLSFTQSLEAFRDLDDLQGIAEAFEGLSAVSSVEDGGGSAVGAARFAGVAESVRESLTAKQYPFDQAGLEPYLTKGRAAIGDQEWEQARQAGREMVLEEAIDWALHA